MSHAPAAPEEDKSVATFKLQVNLVDVFFTVKDKNNNLVPHLNKNDCTVFEDKQPQTFKSFMAENNLPLTLGILLDTSGSQQNVLPLEQDAGAQFLERVLKSKDEAFLLSFDVNVDLLQDFTNSPRLLARAMSKAEINTAGGNGAAGIPGAGGGTVPTIGDPKGTLLYDAIYLASREKLTQESGRKAMIILTDGEDQGSRAKISEAIAAAQKSNAMIYVILIADTGFYGGWGYSGYSAASKLAQETGGPRDQRGQQRQEAPGSLRPDRGRAAYPICGHLHADQRQDGRHASAICRWNAGATAEGPDPPGLLRAGAGTSKASEVHSSQFTVGRSAVAAS